MVNGKLPDSVIYKKVLEFIKKEGSAPLLLLMKDLHSTLNQGGSVNERVFEGKDSIGSVIRRNKFAVEFLRQFEDGFLTGVSLPSAEFTEFLASVHSSMKDIDLYIENARLLEKLNFGVVTTVGRTFDFNYSNMEMEVYKGLDGNIAGINKIYSDQKLIIDQFHHEMLRRIRTERYTVRFAGPADWVFEVQNDTHCAGKRIAHIRNFGFDSSKVPTEDELISHEEPESLKEYKRLLTR